MTGFPEASGDNPLIPAPDPRTPSVLVTQPTTVLTPSTEPHDLPESTLATYPVPLANMVRLLQRLAHLMAGPPSARGRGGLRSLIRTGRRLTQEAESFLASVRALQRYAALLASFGLDAERAARQTQYRDLLRASGDLADTVEAAVSPLDPLRTTHPDYVRTLVRDARNIFDLIHSSETARTIDAFATSGLPPAMVQEFLVPFRQIVASWLEELTHARIEHRIGEALEAAMLSPTTATGLGVLCATGTFGATAAGALPGPDAASVTLIKIVATRRFVMTSGSTADRVTWMNHIAGWLVRAARFDAEETSRFNEAIRRLRRLEPEVRRGLGSVDSDDAVRDAHDLLGRKFQQGPALNTAFAVLNVIQAYSAIIAVDDSTVGPTSILGAGGAAVTALQGAIVTINRIPLNALKVRDGGRLVARAWNASLSRTEATLASASELVEATAGVVTGAIAVLTILQGADAITQGLEAEDYWTVTTGGLQIASGVAIAAGVMMGVPGAQPGGVALGLAAATISLVRLGSEWGVREGNAVQFERMLTALNQHTNSSWNDHPLLSEVHASSQFTALQRAYDATDFSTFNTGMSVPLFLLVRDELHAYGVDYSVMRTGLHPMIDTDLVDAAIPAP